MNNIKIKRILGYIGKLISSAAIVLLLFVGGFLIYYLISAKMVAKNPQYEPKINLYTIVSGSMQPTIKVYDVVIASRIDDPNDIKIGDVITFRSSSAISKDLIVTHRVVDIKEVNGKKEYVTKGDYNATSDSATAKFDRIIGKVVFRLPQLGRIQFFLSSKMGWFVAILLPAAAVIIYDVIKLIKLIMLKKDSGKIEEINDSNKQKQVDDLVKKNEEEIDSNQIIMDTLDKVKKEINVDELQRLKEDLE